jgi:membrane protease subunit (stomatin/prohibitin family)
MPLPFIEIIEWVEQNPNLLMWKFADADKEIKNGAQLTVREGQVAMLLNEGQLADIFIPGRHKLSTANIPVLSRLKGWKYGFESPFKADVYFFSTKQFLNLKWGTPAPILLRDPQFQQVRLRAFGVYNAKITDTTVFFREYAGSYPVLTIKEMEFQLRDYISPKFGEVLAQAQVAVMDIAGNVTALAQRIQPLLQPYFTNIGMELSSFTITSVTLPDEVTAYYDKITGMNMVPDINKYQQFNTANAIGETGTVANEGMQQSMLAGMMINAMQPAQNKPVPEMDITGRLKQLKQWFEEGLISENEYNNKKTELMNKL